MSPGAGGRAAAALLAALAWLSVAPAWAQAAPDAEQSIVEPTDDDDGFEIEFDNNERPAAAHPLAPSLFYAAELELEIETERNYDLDEGEDDNVSILLPIAKLALAYVPSPRFDAAVSFELSREFALEQPAGEDDGPTRLQLKEAYVTFRDLTEGLALKVGRQSFDDEREWLYDEDLDAVRLFYGFESIGLEASVSRETLVDKDLLNEEDEDRINNYFLLGRYYYDDDDDVVFEGYAFFRDDREPDGERPLFLGLRSYGEATGEIDYWAELAYVFGEGELDDDTGTRPDISGFALDLGATYVFDAPLEPSITLGFAYGSGDGDVDESRDGNFRQTGLQDNSASWNGLASFPYYGVVFQPELSNLSIFTAGAGIRPTDETSIDLIFHLYRQNDPVDEFRDSDLNADPTGDSRDLGSEIDLVVAYEPIDALSFEAMFGYFIPGEAFADNDDDAFFVGFETIYVF